MNLIFGDCLEALRQMPDASVDVVITDPPYGVRSREAWDELGYFLSNLHEWMRECLRVTRHGIVWFSIASNLSHVISAAGCYFDRLLIWNKPPGSQFAGASANRLWYSVEPIAVIAKTREFRRKGIDSEFGYSAFDARTIPKAKHGHPTTKPVQLMRWLVEHYSNPDDVVLDPFMGSGTTGVACIECNRQFIGIEKDAVHFASAQKRLSAAALTEAVA